MIRYIINTTPATISSKDIGANILFETFPFNSDTNKAQLTNERNSFACKLGK